MEQGSITYDKLLKENLELKIKLEEASDVIEAIRTGQVDALIVNDGSNHQLYTLKTADQTYRVFIEKMNEGAVTLNSEGTILYANSKLANMLGISLEKVVGTAFSKFVAEVSQERFYSLINNAWEEDCKGEIELINFRYEHIPCMLSCNALKLDEDLALSLILTDLSLLKETERQLKIKNLQLAAAHLATEKLNDELEDIVKARTDELLLSREHFKYLADNIPQMTWTNLPDGEINYFNQQWHAYSGYSLEEFAEFGWQKIIHPDDLEVTNERFLNAISTGDNFEVENRYKRAADGAYRWHLNRSIPLRNENEEIVFWVGTATDIEDQKQETDRRDEFIGVASHELKTPITSLKGYLQLLTSYKKEELPPIVKQYLTRANNSLDKLQHLVNDLLDVSKIKAGMLDYKLTNTDLSKLLRSCTENAQHIYPSNHFEYEDGVPIMVMGNAERLEQVIMNLVNNAVKYSPENKDVTLKIVALEGMARVSVTDQGIGLSAGQIERIFERFYRVEDKKLMTSGLGMGLYISAEIIRHHNGSIGVSSELGKGATFYFNIPLL